MKGLLIKDLKLLKGQKNFFVVLIVIAIVLSVSMSSPSFVIGYMTFIGAVFTLSTISYDEFDNGNAFLFSLPVTRKDYVREKYVFGILVGGASCLLSIVISLVIGLINHSVFLPVIMMSAVMVFAVLFFIIAIMLPFQLKFGGEKGRVAIMIAFGVVILVGLLAAKIAGMFHIDLGRMLSHFPVTNLGVMVAVIYALALSVCFLSMQISVAIMEKKEF